MTRSTSAAATAPRARQDAPTASTTDGGSSVRRAVDHAGCVVELLRAERETFRGRTPAEALT